MSSIGWFLPTVHWSTSARCQRRQPSPQGVASRSTTHRQSGKFYAFVTDVGNTDQYELDGSSGTVTGTLVRQFTRPTATEGLVADDELQRLYIAQEDIGVSIATVPSQAMARRTSW